MKKDFIDFVWQIWASELIKSYMSCSWPFLKPTSVFEAAGEDIKIVLKLSNSINEFILIKLLQIYVTWSYENLKNDFV